LDFNNEINMEDFFTYASCFGKPLTEKSSANELCLLADYNTDKIIDELDFVCFKKEFDNKKGCSCSNNKGLCSDFDSSGLVDPSDGVSLLSCYNQGGDCITKFDYSGNNMVGIEDFVCVKNDMGKSFGQLANCAAKSCVDNTQCGGTYHCSQGRCCPVGEEWVKERRICTRPVGEIGGACTCPFEQDPVTGQFKAQGKAQTSKSLKEYSKTATTDFGRTVSSGACVVYNKVCVFTKRFSKEREQRIVEVEQYGK